MKLYALALFAFKPDVEMDAAQEHDYLKLSVPQRTDGTRSPFNVHVFLLASVWMAGSVDEAREEGMRQIIERCPAADGWMGHRATTAEMSRTALEEALRALPASDEETTEDETDARVM